MSSRAVVASIVAGLLGGLLSGLLGVGGGIAMVPVLAGLAALSQHQAQATSLAAIVPIAAVSAATFALEGSVDYRIGGLLALGSVFGAPLGARLMARSTEGLLKVLFGILMIVAAVQTLWP